MENLTGLSEISNRVFLSWLNTGSTWTRTTNLAGRLSFVTHKPKKWTLYKNFKKTSRKSKIQVQFGQLCIRVIFGVCFCSRMKVLIAEMFQETSPWDSKGDSDLQNLNVYFEDTNKTAVYKVDLKKTLLEILQHERCCNCCNVLSFLLVVSELQKGVLIFDVPRVLGSLWLRALHHLYSSIRTATSKNTFYPSTLYIKCNCLNTKIKRK